jgi:hypothetical protein
VVNEYNISGRVEVECRATVHVGPAVLVVKLAAAAPVAAVAVEEASDGVEVDGAVGLRGCCYDGKGGGCCAG